MRRRLLLAALLLTAPAAHAGHRAVIAPTVSSATDSSDRIATTAWVNSFFASGASLANGKILIGSAGGIATPQTMSGDCTLAASGVITCTKTNGVAFSSLATQVPGTGVAAALGVNIGSAGAPVLLNGVGGTPLSLTLTNATGLPLSGLSGLGTGNATALGVNVGSAGAFTPNNANNTFSGTNNFTGSFTINSAFTGSLVAKLTGVNFNSANTDNSIAIPLPSGFTRYRVSSIIISNSSLATLTTCTFGIFTAASGGGIAIVASATACAITSNTNATSGNGQAPSLALNSATSFTNTPLFFRVQTAQGATATADVSIFYSPIP